MHKINFLKCCIVIWAFPTVGDKNFTPTTDYDAVLRYFEIFNKYLTWKYLTLLEKITSVLNQQSLETP